MSLSTLPADLLHQILLQIPPSTLLSLSSTSTTFRTLCLEDTLWKRFNPSSPQQAYHHYLLLRAWKAGRAICHLHSLEHPVSALHPYSPHPILSSLHPNTSSHVTSPPLPAHCTRIRLSTAKSPFVAYALQYRRVLLYNVGFKLEQIFDVTLNASVNAVDILFTPTPILLAALSSGQLAVIRTSTSVHYIPLSSYPLSSLSVHASTIAIGTHGGELLTTNLHSIHSFIGPCSCTISAVELTSTTLIAGYTHRATGNGHCSAAVSWDLHTGSRIVAFGRSIFSRSSALPMQGVGMICAVGQCVGVLVGERACIYVDWSCVLQLEGVKTVAMDEKRLYAVMEEGMKVFDFEQALSKWPSDVARIR